MLARNDERMMSEEDLQQRAYELMSGYKYVFVLCSSSDPDRLASFYHATVRHHGRLFLADGYQCKLMDAFTKSLGRRDRIYRFTEAGTGYIDSQRPQNIMRLCCRAGQTRDLP